LNVILKDEQLADDVDLDEIANKTVNFSGSDLHELCRNAAMNSFIEKVKSMNTSRQINEENMRADNSEEGVEQEADTSTAEQEMQQHNCIRERDFEIAFQKLSVKSFVNVSKRHLPD
jgi:SpoVK/Ycf46/Vps4 family AAA+-type ATPase